MTPHSSRSRRLWTHTTAFSLHTLPVSSLSSTRSLMGNDVLSPLPHAPLLFAYLISLSRSGGTKAFTHTCERPEFEPLVYIFRCRLSRTPLAILSYLTGDNSVLLIPINHQVLFFGALLPQWLTSRPPSKPCARMHWIEPMPSHCVHWADARRFDWGFGCWVWV